MSNIIKQENVEVIPNSLNEETVKPTFTSSVAFANSQMYHRASELQLTPEETKALTAPFSEDKLRIKGNGLVYLPSVFLRQRLNEVIGIGQWALIPRGNPMVQGNRVIYHGALYIRGCFIAEAIGGQEYIPENNAQSWDDAVEGAKTDCLSRCCKDLGMNAECWDKDFCNKWISKYATKKWDDKKHRYIYFKDEGKSKPTRQTLPPPQANKQTAKKPVQITNEISDILEDLGDGIRFKDEEETETEGEDVLNEIITFGKHKGARFGDVPIGYLQGLTKPTFWNAISDENKEKIKKALKLRGK